VALKLGLCCALLFVTAVSAATAATEKHANRCLRAHHVRVGARPAKDVTRFGVRVYRYEGFSFAGIPAKIYDNGQLIFERTHAAAVRAKATLFAKLVAFQIANSQDSPFHIRESLRAREAIVHNVVIFWNNEPQTKVAKAVVYGCLR
jgi:hypothetical protein